MKRLLILLVLVFALLVWTTGCASKNGGNQLDGLQDGIYFGFSEFSDNKGWTPFLKLEVKKGSIDSVRFDYIHHEGFFKSEDMDYSEKMEAHVGLTPRQVIEQLVTNLKEGKVLPVEAISGASETSTWFNRILIAVVERAKDGDTRPVLITPASIIYSSEDEPDGDGWIGKIELTFEGKTISAVTYDEIKRLNGEVVASKHDSLDYAQRWNNATNIKLLEVYERLGEQLMHEGKASGVDLISGASVTSSRFRNLANEAGEKRIPVDFVTLMQTL